MMPDEYLSRLVIDTSRSLAKRLNINCVINSILDVNISLFEQFLSLLDSETSKNESDDLEARYQFILDWLSSELESEISHISATSLANFDPLHLKNLLEIFSLLLEENISGDATLSYKVPEPRLTSLSAKSDDVSGENGPDEIAAVNCSAVSCPLSIVGLNLESRLEYLQSKLAQMFPPEDCSLWHNQQKISNRLDRTPPKRLFDSASDSQTESVTQSPPSTAAPVPVPAPRCKLSAAPASRSILKPVEVPLSHVVAPISFRWSDPQPRYTRRRNGVALLEDLLRELPGITLSRETQNYLQKRLESFYSSNDSSRSTKDSAATSGDMGMTSALARSLSELELKQRERLTLIHRQEERTTRLHASRNQEDFCRQLRAEMRERKRQEVRARCYQRQFVDHFRAQKLAQKADEELLFRRIFEKALEIERQHRLEERKVAREIREKETRLQKSILDDLQYAHTERIRILREEDRNLQQRILHEEKENKLAS
nr:unnamed protein product [Spirometra erinaceieuropaei]